MSEQPPPQQRQLNEATPYRLRPIIELEPSAAPYRANGHVLMPVSGYRKADGTWQWHHWNAEHDPSCPCGGDESQPDW